MGEQDTTQTTNENADMNAGAENTGAEQNAETTKGEERKFTQADMDKVIGERLKKAEAKKQTEIDLAVKRAMAEYDRKAKMTEAERAAEASKQREDELTKREHELAVRENRNRAIEELRKKNIPVSLVDHIATADADETDDNIAAFEQDWTNALAEAVKDAARGSAPRDQRSVEDKSASNTTKYNGTQVL